MFFCLFFCNATLVRVRHKKTNCLFCNLFFKYYYSLTSVVASSVTVSTVSSTTGASVSTAGASSGAASTASSFKTISFV